jgi:hypothetical protein
MAELESEIGDIEQTRKREKQEIGVGKRNMSQETIQASQHRVRL